MLRSGMRTSPSGTCVEHLRWMMRTRTGFPLAPGRNRRQLTHPQRHAAGPDADRRRRSDHLLRGRQELRLDRLRPRRVAENVDLD
jgi:hypothetical protein